MTTSIPVHQAKAELFRTLGHPMRIRILEMLQVKPTAVRDMLTELEAESSSLSQQLAVLRRAGLVTASREGATVVYALGTPHIGELLKAGRQILAEILSESEGLLAELREQQ
ncbi:MAG: metalloregulator ArsR/SmtB family transcription factor [Nocardioides sp.]|nr:metalloregulator ArsR/SmtB family transcription factor [Nocardioides sp.]